MEKAKKQRKNKNIKKYKGSVQGSYVHSQKAIKSACTGQTLQIFFYIKGHFKGQKMEKVLFSRF